jgi:hypothetical protein
MISCYQLLPMTDDGSACRQRSDPAVLGVVRMDVDAIIEHAYRLKA